MDIKKHWPTIKIIAGKAYSVFLVAAVIANAYAGKTLPMLAFLMILALSLLGDSLSNIAEAIRTRRNFFVIGDGNTIPMAGANLHADHVSVQKGAAEVNGVPR